MRVDASSLDQSGPDPRASVDLGHADLIDIAADGARQLAATANSRAASGARPSGSCR
jgi:hypothetical protein